MSTTQQPEATRLADKYEIEGFLQDHRFAQNEWCRQAAAEPETREALAKRLIADVQVADTIATSACQRVAELPDRASPADWPESMLVTGDELHMIVREAVIEAQSAPAYPAEGVPAQIETLQAELAEEIEAAENWRRLALQFDNHRLQALGHLKAILHPDSSVDEYKTAELFLKAPPLDGESVLAQRIAELSATTQAQADAQDTDRWMGIGKAIERASADLPEETEIIVSLEKDAGTVTLIDQDGNEHENFSCDYGFAGVLNEAIDAAIAAQAKKGKQE